MAKVSFCWSPKLIEFAGKLKNGKKLKWEKITIKGLKIQRESNFTAEHLNLHKFWLDELGKFQL